MGQRALAFCLALLVSAGAWAGISEPIDVTLTQTVTPLDDGDFFVPGTTQVDVELAFDRVVLDQPACDSVPAACNITSFGIETTLPAGFTFDSVVSGSPGGTNVVGDTLSVFYITVPPFPSSVTVRLNVASDPVTPVTLSSTALYRTNGGELTSDPAETVLQVEPTTVTIAQSLSGAGVDLGDPADPNDNFYQPGESFQVAVEFTRTGTSAFSSLGLDTTLPTGFSFAGIDDGASDIPAADVSGVSGGATGTLNFSIDNIPTLPATLVFDVDIDASATGSAVLESTANFDAGAGAETSNTESVTLEEEPCVAFTRVVDPASYTAGGQLSVTITFSIDCPSAVTSLGIDEVLPTGFTFDSIDTGNSPNAPSGSTVTGNTVSFFYIAPPPDGASFTYIVDVDPGLMGDVDISGVTLYRLTGGELQSRTVVTTVLDQDTTPPVITLDVADPLTLECSTDTLPATADLVTATDNVDGDITDQVVVGGDTVDTSAPGTYTLTFDVSDAAGNDAAQVTLDVEVVDTTDPTAVAISDPIDIEVGVTGVGDIDPAVIDDGSFDLCDGDLTFSVSPEQVACADIGTPVTVTLTVTDDAGNTDTATATVNAVDTTAPELTTQPVTLELDASGNATLSAADVVASAVDTCSTVALGVSRTDFTCADIGAPVTVTVTATDDAGNVATETAVVTVEDNIAPTAAVQAFTASLGANGSVTIDASDIDNGSTDNCGVASLSVSPDTFTCADVDSGTTVTLTVTDTSGNTDTASALVTVVDDIAPTALAQDISVALGADGTATIAPADVDAGSSDNCDVTLSLDRTSFACADLGANVVTLTATDPSGNTATETATVTVTDETAPVLGCQDITVPLDADGNATLSAADIVASLSDNCDTDPTLSIDVSSFDCADVGANTVVVTATDDSGNTATCTATVTVVDDLAPTAEAAPATVAIGEGGTVTITGADVDGGSDDNCSLDSLSVEPSTFTCEDLGENTVTLTVSDTAGNVASATTTVTVTDPGNFCDPNACDDLTVDILTPSGDLVVPTLGSTTDLTLTSSVTPNPFGCTAGDITVSYVVDDGMGPIAVGNSSDADGNFPVSATFPVPGTFTVTATATGTGTGTPMGSDTFVFSITTVNDLNGDGYLDNPFADLPNDGDTFTNEVTTDDPDCSRAIVQIAFDGGVEGPDPVAVLQNPFDPNQTLVVSVPRTVISAPQRAVLVVAIGCSLDALYEGDVTELTSDLPVDDLVAGNAFFEVSILVLDDPETQEPTDYREIDDPAPTPEVLKQGLGATVSLTGLNFSPGLTPDFISHPTTAAATGEVTIEETKQTTVTSIFEVLPAPGSWTSATASSEASGTTLTATIDDLSSAFAAIEIFDAEPELTITPDPRFEAIVGIAQVGETVNTTFTVTNTGGGTLTGFAVLTNTGSDTFALVGEADYSLATGESDTVTVSFTPSGAMDFRGTITFNGGDPQEETVTLRGTGTTPLDKPVVILGCAGGSGASGSPWGDAIVVLLALGALLAATRLRKGHQA